MIKTVQINISGKVQGVFFRQSTLMKAKELGINGIIKNLKGGEVYIEAEGTENEIEELISWCRDEGSSSSAVSGIKVVEQNIKSYTRFEIVR